MSRAKFGFLCVCLVLARFGYTQEKSDLYYAQPPNTGLYLGFVYVSPENFVLAGLHQLFLFNRQKLMVDTLNLFYQSPSFLDNVNHVALIDNGLISVSTLGRTLLVLVRNDQFEIVADYSNKELVKQLGKYDLFVLFKQGILTRSIKGKSTSHYYFAKSTGTSFKSEPTENLTPDTPDVTVYKGTEILGFSKYQALDEVIFIFNRKKNVIYGYNTVTGQKTEIILPSVDPTKEIHEFYIDQHTRKCYIVKISDDENKIFLMSPKDNSFKQVANTKYLVRGVFDGKLYVSGVFDGAVAHYLVPIEGQSAPVNFIEND